MKIKVGVSNRHVHLNKADLQFLFGESYILESLRPINQPGQYASTQTVSIMTDKNRIDGVRVLGPVRDYTQVEISRTDAYKLGIDPPIKSSGDLDGSLPITIIGPKGILKKENGCIQANRHIHITRELLTRYGLNENDVVCLKVAGEKGGILKNVTFRVDDNAFLEAHLDTDDANAFMIKNGDVLDVVKMK